jgi:hypothetical protein
MVRIFRVIFAFFLLCLTVANAQNITVSASTDTSVYKVGDYIKYQLELHYDKNVHVILPLVKDSIKVLEFIQELPVEKKEENTKITETHNYIFSKYDSSQVTIPSLKIYYSFDNDTVKKYLATAPITIIVRTLPVDAQNEIKDIKEPIKLPLDWRLIALLVVCILLILTAAIWGYRYYRKKKLNKGTLIPAKIIPPFEIALNELKILEGKKLWQQGQVKEYHSEITEIIRKYFEDRFNFRALEMTSAEILGVLSYIEDGRKVVDLSSDFFTNADLVKFAKFQPLTKVNEEMMRQAYKIINVTIPIVNLDSDSEDQNAR